MQGCCAEVFSPEAFVGGVRMTRAVAVMALRSRVTCLRVLKCLIRALALSARARMEVISPLAPSGVGVGVWGSWLGP